MILERDHTRTTFVLDIKFVFIPSIHTSDENCKIFLFFQTVSSRYGHLGHRARSQEKIWKRTIQGVSYSNLDQWLFRKTSKCNKLAHDRRQVTYAERHMMGKIPMILWRWWAQNHRGRRCITRISYFLNYTQATKIRIFKFQTYWNQIVLCQT